MLQQGFLRPGDRQKVITSSGSAFGLSSCFPSRSRASLSIFVPQQPASAGFLVYRGFTYAERTIHRLSVYPDGMEFRPFDSRGWDGRFLSPTGRGALTE